ncbi:MAG TPA: TPM domain-containing protein [Burkholderiales bacterium]|nr:TPM domain-containing protein [Burkholderiales bacterium]
MVKRALKHLFTPHWLALRAFPASALKAVERAIKASERLHRGEIRFALEGPLHLWHLRATPRERARQVFAQLGVWDTEENTGALIYVQLVDRRIEILADRGIAARVAQHEWDTICRGMERAFKAGQYEHGALEAIAAVTRILAREFPARDVNPNQLPDKPAVL